MAMNLILQSRNRTQLLLSKILSTNIKFFVSITHTTYDLCRNQDSLNPCTWNADFMILAPKNNDNTYPYWYGRILRIFHANVHHIGPHSCSSQSQKMEFLFICWFGRDTSPIPGWKRKRLNHLGFVPGNDEQAFGFINPSQVIHAVHLIPALKWNRWLNYSQNQSLHVVSQTQCMIGSSTMYQCKQSHNSYQSWLTIIDFLIDFLIETLWCASRVVLQLRTTKGKSSTVVFRQRRALKCFVQSF